MLNPETSKNLDQTQDGANRNHDGRGKSGSAIDSTSAVAAGSASPAAADSMTTRLRKLHSAPIDSFLTTRMDMESLRCLYILNLQHSNRSSSVFRQAPSRHLATMRSM